MSVIYFTDKSYILNRSGNLHYRSGEAESFISEHKWPSFDVLLYIAKEQGLNILTLDEFRALTNINVKHVKLQGRENGTSEHK